MATATFYALTNDGYLYGNSTSYETARANIDAVSSATDRVAVGQYYDGSQYCCREGFMNFDTSTLPAGCTVTGATLYLYGKENALYSHPLTLEVYPYNWGDTLTGSDGVAGASLQSMYSTVAATYDCIANGWSTTAYNVLGSTAQMAAAINKTGKTRFMVAYKELRTDFYYAGGYWYEYVSWVSGESGTSSTKPKLIVTYTTASGGGGGTVSVSTTSVDYARKVYWPSSMAVDGSASSPWNMRFNCEEGISAQDRGYFVSGGFTPVASAYWDYALPIPQGGLQIPAGTMAVAIAYAMPTADNGLCTLQAYVTCDGGAWTSSTVTQALPSNGNAPSLYVLPITVSGTAGAVARLATTNAYLHVVVSAYTGTGTKLYPVPSDALGTVPCGHVGVAYAAGSSYPASWTRPAPVIVLSSPHAGSHANPTLVGANPVLKFTSTGLYPTDNTSVTIYSDSLRNQAHQPADQRPQMASDVGDVTAQIMLPGTVQRYIELGDAPFQLQSPDLARNSAPTATKWVANQHYNAGQYVIPTLPWDEVYVCSTAGTSGSTEPQWWMDGSTQAEGPDTLAWSDAGARFTFGTNTVYEVAFTDGLGNAIQTIDLEALLDINDPLLVNGSLDPPQLVPMADCTASDPVTLQVERMASHTDPNPLYVEFELIHPDGSVYTWTVGHDDQIYVGYLEGA